MPHRREALHNFVAMLGPKARITDPEKLLAGLEGMGVSFDGQGEAPIGMLHMATARDLRDNYIDLPNEIARVAITETGYKARYVLFELDEALRAIGFTIARCK